MAADITTKFIMDLSWISYPPNLVHTGFEPNWCKTSEIQYGRQNPVTDFELNWCRTPIN